MSYNVFPTLVGRGWGIKKRPITSTLIQQADSGAEYRTSRYQYPLYEFDIEIPYMGNADYDNVIGFFNQQGGPFTPFYFNVDNDNSATNQAFGTGDGTTTAFQLTNTYGSYWSEPIGGINGNPQIFRQDWQGNQLMYATPRTNLCLYSSTFTNASWTQTYVTVGTTNNVAPDGSSTATHIAEQAVSQAVFFIQNNLFTTTSPTGNLVFSCYAKAAELGYAVLQIGGTSPALQVVFNLTTGANNVLSSGQSSTYQLVAGSPTATSVGNGWWRLSIEVVKAITTSGYTGRIGLTNSMNPTAYTGDGASGIYIWGAQLEYSNVPTAYIPTTSAAVTVTDYGISASGLVTFSAAPLAGASLTWTGLYYYLVRFKDDHIETEQTMSNIFQATTITLRTFR